MLIIKSARQKQACKPGGSIQQGTHWWLCKAATSFPKRQKDSCWHQTLPGHQGILQERCWGLQSMTRRRRTKQRMAESWFFQLTPSHRAGSQELQWVTTDETISWVRHCHRKCRCEQRSATVTTSQPLSQTLAFTGSRLPCCLKTQEVKAVSLPAQLPSVTNIEQ